MKNKIFETLYNIGFKEESDIMDKLKDDVLYNKAMSQFKKTVSGDFIQQESSTYINYHKVSETDIVGVEVISGKRLKELSDEESIRIIEKRIIGDEYNYYIFMIVYAVEDYDEYFTLYLKRCIIDGISRMMDYYLDIICKEESQMTELCKRDGIPTSSPEAIIAKHLLLSNLNYTLSIIDEIVKPTDKCLNPELYSIIDTLINPNTRTDWFQMKEYFEFKVEAKFKIFEPQLNLKQEIFGLIGESRNQEYLESMNGFYNIYKNLLIDGGIYELDQERYPWINKFIALGTNAFSTVGLNEVWKQYI